MENDEYKLFEEFKAYNKAIFDYEQKIDLLEKTKKKNSGKGYLVFYDDLTEIKKVLNYNNYKVNKYSENKILSIFKQSKYETMKKLESINVKSAEYLKNLIININCVLITEELFDLINDNIKNQISYSVQDRILNLFINNNKSLELTHRYFKLNEFSYDMTDPTYKDISNILDSMWNFFNFEQKMNNQFNRNIGNKGKGFLVKKTWLDEWKMFSNYDYFKDKYFFQVENNRFFPDVKKSIYKEIIEYREIYKNKRILPNEENIITIDKKDESKNIFQMDPILLDSTFTNFFPYFKKYNSYQYTLSDGRIEIQIRGKDPIILEYNNKTISRKNNNEIETNSNNDLKQLIKIFFFQKYCLHANNKNNKGNIISNQIFLINKSIIQKYKNDLNYSELSKNLEKIISNISEIKNSKNDINYNQIVDKILDKTISDLSKKYNYNISKDNKNSKNNYISKTFTIKKMNKFSKVIEYIDDFELINEDIHNYFVTQKIVSPKDIIKGEIILDNKNTCLIFNYNNNNFYEIGYIYENGDFQVNYLIKENNYKYKNNIINTFKEFGITEFINKDFQDTDPIWGENKVIGHFYCINQIDNESKKNIEEENKTNENKFINNVISFIISIHFFNLDINENTNQKSFNYSRKKLSSINGYLINKTQLSQLKNIIFYEKISTKIGQEMKSCELKEKESFIKKIISEKNDDVHNMILNNKNKILEFLESNKLKEIDFCEVEIDNNIYYSPTNFEIISEEAHKYLLELIGINNEDKENQLNFGINNGKIYIKFLQYQDYDFDMFLFGYILNIKNEEDINYGLQSILFYNSSIQRNKDFDKIINGKKIDDSMNCSIIYDERGRKIGNIYLFENTKKNNEIEPYIKPQVIENNKNKDYTNLRKYIKYSIILYIEYSNINLIYNDKENFSEENNGDDIYYFINQNYLKKLESIIHFKDIIEKNEKMNYKGKKYNSEDELVENIVNEIKNEKIGEELNQIDNKKFDELNNKELFEIKANNKIINSVDYSFYQNCRIINEKIYKTLIEIDHNFIKQSKYKLFRCLFRNCKAITFIDNKVINIGILDNNNLFIPEKSICTALKNNNSLRTIFDLIKAEGLLMIEQYIKDGEISFKNPGHYTVFKAKIYNLNEKENMNDSEKIPYIRKKAIKGKASNSFNINNISDELKLLIILLLSQENTERNYWRNKFEKEEVYLLNKKWIEKFEKNDVNNLEEKINFIYSQNYKNYNLQDIISKIDCSILENLDNKIKANNLKIDLNADSKKIKLCKKTINLYTEFVLINKDMLNKYDKNIKNNFNKSNISYVKKINDDMIIINEFFQPIILIGNYNEKTYSYDIKYIFDYKNKNILEDEMKYILKDIKDKDINHYINQNSDLITNSNYVSPIFNYLEIIGSCYKYDKFKSDYTSDIDYSEILCDQNLISSMALANNYQIINNYIGNIDEIKGETFYLISLDSMKKLKKECNYENIYEFIKKSSMDINIFEKDTNYKLNLLNSIRSIDYYKLMDILTVKNNNINTNYEYETSFSDLIAVPVDYINSKNEYNSIMIYKDFEIISADLIDKLFDSKFLNQINHFECIFTLGKLIINYPDKILGNKEYISMIGGLNEKDIFQPEYILIYQSSYKRKPHIDKIKSNIIEFIESFNFSESKKSDIILDKKIEMGIIVKYDTNNNNVIIPNPNPTPTIDPIPPKPIPEPIPNDPGDDVAPIPIPRPKTIRDYFNESPLIGLQNIGATCYMNATLQCFSHIEKFVDFFKYHQQPLSIYNSNSNTLTYSFKKLIDNLWPNNFDPNKKGKTYYAPEEFKSKISTMNPLFEGIAANDAKDLVNFIIMTLHEELNKGINTNNDEDYLIDQTDQIKVFNNFTENFKKSNQSIISDIFYSMNFSITECSNCHIKLYNYQIYFFLVFPLEEIRKFKNEQLNQNMSINMNMNMNMNNMNFINYIGNNNFMINNNFIMQNNNIVNNNQSNEVDILDCFNYETKQNTMAGSNAMYCNNCKITCACYMRTILATGPEIFILLLNRGKGIQFEVKLNFTEYLDLSNYIQFKETGYYYRLIGVITHIGGNDMSGHFIAFCRDPLSEKWHKYNDAIVTEVVDFQSEVIDFCMPYLLFYQKIK